MTVQDLIAAKNRVELAALLRSHIPSLAAEDAALSSIVGGRTAALAALEAVEPDVYERSRNFLSGAVTRLSPYLRHGVLTLAEVRDFALAKVRKPEQAGKLINELAWRDYWQRLYAEMGAGVWQDREAFKTGFLPPHYAAALPEELVAGATSLVCMDAFSRDLKQTGYLHNHARMWMAAYVVHWLGVRWQAGARWFLEHLLDGDAASNNLSWQWVASTFSNKPYIFNRENLARYTANVYCDVCPHARAGTCPFEGFYEDLTDRLFPRLTDAAASSELPRPPLRPMTMADRKPSAAIPGNPLLWVHPDSLNPASPIFARWPQSPSVFVWDSAWLTEERISLQRVLFLAECLQQMPPATEVRFGDPAAEVLAVARATGAASVVTQRTPDPRLVKASLQLERSLPVVLVDPPPFVENTRGFDLKRFSRYWQRAQSAAMQPTRPASAG